MNDKPTIKFPDLQVHRPPAGLVPGDYCTELFGIRETRKVFAICDGRTIPFADINPDLRAMLLDMLLDDDAAMADLKHLPWDEALEEFAFCIYGAADHNPDFCEKGKAGSADNFLCSLDCKCLAWKSKKITLNGYELTPRQVKITQLLASDMPDKQIADMLGIALATLDGHKRDIYIKAGVQSKGGLIMEAVNQKVIQ